MADTSTDDARPFYGVLKLLPLSGILSVTYVILKVTAVARGDRSTALAILDGLGVASVVSSVAYDALWNLAVVGFLLGAMRYSLRSGLLQADTRGLLRPELALDSRKIHPVGDAPPKGYALEVVVTLLLALLSPLWEFFVAFPLALAIYSPGRHPRKIEGGMQIGGAIGATLASPEPGVRYMRLAYRRKWVPVFAVALSIALLLVILFKTSMWLPAESLNVNSKPVIGYVVGTQGGVVTVLTEPERRIRRIPENEILGREVCDYRRPPAIKGAHVPNWLSTPSILTFGRWFWGNKGNHPCSDT